LATVEKLKADVSSGTPSSERIKESRSIYVDNGGGALLVGTWRLKRQADKLVK